MNSSLVKILAAFIPGKKRRHLFRQMHFCEKIKGREGNDILIERPHPKLIRIRGKNNRIIFRKSSTPLRLRIDIYGNNNLVEIGENVNIHGEFCKLCIVANNAKFSIGKDTNMHTVDFLLTENGSQITIGEDCLFSWGISCWATDGHTILNTDSGGGYNQLRKVYRDRKPCLGRHGCQNRKKRKNRRRMHHRLGKHRYEIRFGKKCHRRRHSRENRQTKQNMGVSDAGQLREIRTARDI